MRALPLLLAVASLLGIFAPACAQRVDSGGIQPVRIVVVDGFVLAQAAQPVRLRAAAFGESRLSLDVASPRLWQGTSDPYLYSLLGELRDRRGKVIDRQRQPLGIRQFAIDTDKGFSINGKHVPLHGVGYHQDDMNTGWAMSRQQTAERFATIRDMGANTIRLTHYQHGPDIHDLANRHGLVLWDEIGLGTAWTLDPGQGDAPEDTPGSADQRPRGRPPVLARIEPALRDQLTSFREGTFSYAVPVAPGRHQVTVRFVEPSAKPGQRVFSVLANGRVVIQDLDIAVQASAALVPVTRSFVVNVAQGPLELAFVPSKGQAIVSAIEIVAAPAKPK